jgi:ABC-type nitrate/sulfonate/bicarbonate transport system substrate-binding protein
MGRHFFAIAIVAMLTASLGGTAPAQTSVKVMVFPSLSNIATYAAQSKGFFAKRGLAVEILHTPNSEVLREGLAKGNHQIVHAAVDNAVAMADVAKHDIAVILGGDGGHNELFVRPEIKSYEDIRGKTVLVDAPDTAYGLLLYKMLDVKGLKKGDYQVKPAGGTTARLKGLVEEKSGVAAMLNPPFSITAARQGMHSLGAAAEVVGAYQAGSAWLMRAWGRENAATVVQYIQAHVEALRWALDPAHKNEAIALLGERLKLPPDVAALSYEAGLNPANGFAKDAKFNLEGFRNVLKLRAEMLGTWGGTPPAPDKYLDFSYYQQALADL